MLQKEPDQPEQAEAEEEILKEESEEPKGDADVVTK